VQTFQQRSLNSHYLFSLIELLSKVLGKMKQINVYFMMFLTSHISVANSQTSSVHLRELRSWGEAFCMYPVMVSHGELMDFEYVVTHS
jgi:hypothetical protein